MRRSLWLACLALALGCAVPLVDPPPLATHLSPEQTRLAIHRGLALQGFVVEEDVPGRVRGKLARRGFAMAVDVTYGELTAIRYADSESLDYERRGGREYVHGGYNERVQRLHDSIEQQARLILAEVDPDAFLGSPPVGTQR